MNEPDRAEAEALFFRGNHHMAAGDFKRAETCFRLAVEIAPYFAEAYANLGLLQNKRGATGAAEISYRRALEQNPDIAETHLNLGTLLAKSKRFDQAETAYRQAIAIEPQSPVAWSNLGVLQACMKREAEAEASYRHAIVIDASYAMARFNLSYLLLRQGRFKEGWFCLEARNWYAGLAEHLNCPRWQGETLAGKSILIGYEAGLGDMIQFCRYAVVLKNQGVASITLLCHPPLKTLLATLDGIDHVIAFDQPLPASNWDFWTPLLSLPYHCNTRLDSIPANIPYLKAQPQLLSKWQSVLPKSDFCVGLVWKGNPLFENDADRSLPSLEILAPLWRVAGVTFISLQKGAGEDEAAHPPLGLQLLDLGHQLDDFADTAALVINLDLIISVDTAVAHLAGALGKPCWILLPDYKTDWRWLTARPDSPWYPQSMRLFRQPCTADWSSVISEVAGALEILVSEAPD